LSFHSSRSIHLLAHKFPCTLKCFASFCDLVTEKIKYINKFEAGGGGWKLRVHKNAVQVNKFHRKITEQTLKQSNFYFPKHFSSLPPLFCVCLFFPLSERSDYGISRFLFSRKRRVTLCEEKPLITLLKQFFTACVCAQGKIISLNIITLRKFNSIHLDSIETENSVSVT
jgi:Zn-finger protein